jgi:hypothetical protein
VHSICGISSKYSCEQCAPSSPSNNVRVRDGPFELTVNQSLGRLTVEGIHSIVPGVEVRLSRKRGDLVRDQMWIGKFIGRSSIIGIQGPGREIASPARTVINGRKRKGGEPKIISPQR